MVRNPEGLLARQARIVKISIGDVPMKTTGIVGGVHILDAGEPTAEQSQGGPSGNDEGLDLRGHDHSSLAM
jgi:hypothetical protein